MSQRTGSNTPAPGTTISAFSNWFSATSNNVASWSHLVTSVWTNTAFASLSPVLYSSTTTFASGLNARSAKITLQPLLKSSLANDRFMPEPAPESKIHQSLAQLIPRCWADLPVTIAVLLVTLRAISFAFYFLLRLWLIGREMVSKETSRGSQFKQREESYLYVVVESSSARDPPHEGFEAHAGFQGQFGTSSISYSLALSFKEAGFPRRMPRGYYINNEAPCANLSLARSLLKLV